MSQCETKIGQPPNLSSNSRKYVRRKQCDPYSVKTECRLGNELVANLLVMLLEKKLGNQVQRQNQANKTTEFAQFTQFAPQRQKFDVNIQSDYSALLLLDVGYTYDLKDQHIYQNPLTNYKNVYFDPTRIKLKRTDRFICTDGADSLDPHELQLRRLLACFIHYLQRPVACESCGRNRSLYIFLG